MPFVVALGEQCQYIETVAMDMNTAFDREFQMNCPKAHVVYDLFHVVAKYGRSFKSLPGESAQTRQSSPQTCESGTMVLLENRSNLTEKQEGYLDELLASNRELMIVYLLREQLKEMWCCKNKKEALAH